MTQTVSRWFMFYNNLLLLREASGGAREIPRAPTPPLPGCGASHHLGLHDGSPCVAYAVAAPPDASAWTPVGLRDAYDMIGEELYTIAGKGYELLHWDRHTQYCPACGTKTVPATPLSKKCPHCDEELFPHISVAILVLVRKGDAALLVRGHNFRGNHMGLVAGFLEPGETLEECVSREVREETDLQIAHIRYFGSQPWPYPSGLMVGFMADYLQGELKLQTSELSHGGFFSRDALPELPQKLSLARRIIAAWLAGWGT